MLLSTSILTGLPHGAMHSAVVPQCVCVICPSVCLSVRDVQVP